MMSWRVIVAGLVSACSILWSPEAFAQPAPPVETVEMAASSADRAAEPAQQVSEDTSEPANVQPGKPTKGPGLSASAPVAARPLNDLGIALPGVEKGGSDSAAAVRIVLGLTLLAVLPSLLVCVTAFLRIVIVLSMLRHAIGMPETPPNSVVIGLALFLTLFTMNPVLQRVNADAVQPFLEGKLSVQQGVESAAKPLREFMVRQTREEDLALMVEISKSARPTSVEDISNVQLVPAFMLTELRAAFQIGFVIFLPFLLIDLIVSSILMSLGMMMMPPTSVALPIKILMFVLIDGWSLLVKALVGSFH
jgi:flagellar biosynthesis protein FliP